MGVDVENALKYVIFALFCVENAVYLKLKMCYNTIVEMYAYDTERGVTQL